VRTGAGCGCFATRGCSWAKRTHAPPRACGASRSVMSIPWVDYGNMQVGEMPDVSRGKLRSTRDDDPRNLRFTHVNVEAVALSPCRQVSGRLGRRLIEIKYASFQVLDHEFVERGFEASPALSLGQNGQPEPCLKKRDLRMGGLCASSLLASNQAFASICGATYRRNVMACKSRALRTKV
jgi:hypothetical protein